VAGFPFLKFMSTNKTLAVDLEPLDTINLQLVSRSFRVIARDDTLWRSHCFEHSSFLEVIDRHHRLSLLRQAAAVGIRDIDDSDEVEASQTAPVTPPSTPPSSRKHDRKRIMANWDPCFPEERISWYDEYIQRHGPITVNWMQEPGDFVGVRGVALYRPDNPHGESGLETLLAVSPLDDGSVCLWDVNGTKGKRGAIIAKSQPAILLADGPNADRNRPSRRVDSGVTECVSVDSEKHRAFFAVQSRAYPVSLSHTSR